MIFSTLILSGDRNDPEALVVLTVGVMWVLIAFLVTVALSALRKTRNGRNRVFNQNAVLLPYEQIT